MIAFPSGRGCDEELRRFVRGAKAAANIQHPNVVQVINAGRDGGKCFLVQRYVPGDSLKELMISSGNVSEEVLLEILSDVASGLEAVHRSGVVHRDVKPANIIIGTSGKAVLVDFGLARPSGMGDVSGGSEIVGTPYYMSPEQCEACAIDGRSDLYSLGVTAYHALSGCLPIQGDTPMQVLRGHLKQVPRALTQVTSSVSDATSRLVLRLLAKDPNERFQSAGELLAALNAIRT